MWGVDAGEGITHYVKRNRTSAKARRELVAYFACGRELGSWIPELVAESGGDHPMLLMTAVSGTIAEKRELYPDEEEDVHFQAGQFLRELHGVPLNDGNIPLDEAIQARIDSWFRRAEGIVDDLILDQLRSECAPEAFRGAARSWAHRDFSPRNWVLSRSARLRVIDFGHCRPDTWLADILKLWDGPWVNRPRLEDAFWRGYGRRMDDVEQDAFRTLCAWHGVATTVWSHEHNDDKYEAHGRAVIARVLGA